METKKCNTCKKDKLYTEFYKYKKNSDGHRHDCKFCFSQKNKAQYQENRDFIKNRVKVYTEKNKKKVSEYQKKYSKSNRRSLSSYNKKYREENKKIISKQRKKYREKNKKVIAEKKKIYHEENKERISKGRKVYRDNNRKKLYENRRDKIESDPLFSLRVSIPKLFRVSYKRKSFKKGTLSRLILGCPYEELLEHLNNNPYGFKCGDEGLDFDHIIPIAEGNTKEEITWLNHYTNLQLLPSEYNRHIKMDNPWDKTHFEQWLKNEH